jgi:hypothetical protein
MKEGRRYTELQLELRDLDAEACTFKVSLLPSAVGESRSAIAVSVDFDKLKEDLQNLEDKYIKRGRLIELGERLAALLLPPGTIRELFARAVANAGQDGGVRLRLIVREPRLMQLPWEFAYLQLHEGEKDRRHFLALNPQISIVRHEALESAQPTLEVVDPARLRLVALMANAEGMRRLNLRREREVIEKAMQGFDVDGVTVEWKPFVEDATPTELGAALLGGADLFHFAGHGIFDTDGTGAGYIVLVEDKQSRSPYLLPSAELAAQLQSAGVRVAVLGACQSGRRDGVSAWTGVAPTLIERGVPAVVAMQYEVVDHHAAAFSRMFYAALAAGLSVDEAVAAGRLAMVGESNEEEVEWGVPVLYMRAGDGRLFRRAQGHTAETEEQILSRIKQVVKNVRQGAKLVGIKARFINGSFSVEQFVEGDLEGSVIGIEADTLGTPYKWEEWPEKERPSEPD